ncbi:MAG TPA: hypothetical protein VGN55_25765 [Xanthobacteraceae bacterium]|jgi:hypothetical protein
MSAPNRSATRRVRLILGGLLHQPGLIENARKHGLGIELIVDRDLLPVFRLIERGHMAVLAAIRGSDVTPAAAAARALRAEIRPLEPGAILSIIRDLVTGVEFPDDDEPTEDEVAEPVPQPGQAEHAGPIRDQRDHQDPRPPSESRPVPSARVVVVMPDDDDDDELSGMVVADPPPPPYGRAEGTGPKWSKRRPKPEPPPKINPVRFSPGLDPKTFTEMKLLWLDEMNTDADVSPMEFRALFRMASHYMDPETAVITVGLQRLADDIGGTRPGVRKVLGKAIASGRLKQLGESPRGGRGRTCLYVPMFSEAPKLQTQLAVKRLSAASAQTPPSKRNSRPTGKGKKAAQRVA